MKRYLMFVSAMLLVLAIGIPCFATDSDTDAVNSALLAADQSPIDQSLRMYSDLESEYVQVCCIEIAGRLYCWCKEPVLITEEVL